MSSLLNFSPKNIFLLLNVVQSKFFISLKSLLKTMFFFLNKTEVQLKFFSDLITVDYPIFLLRFLSIYNVVSMVYNIRIFIKTILGLNQTVDSVTNTYICSS